MRYILICLTLLCFLGITGCNAKESKTELHSEAVPAVSEITAIDESLSTTLPSNFESGTHLADAHSSALSSVNRTETHIEISDFSEEIPLDTVSSADGIELPDDIW